MWNFVFWRDSKITWNQGSGLLKWKSQVQILNLAFLLPLLDSGWALMKASLVRVEKQAGTPFSVWRSSKLPADECRGILISACTWTQPMMGMNASRWWTWILHYDGYHQQFAMMGTNNSLWWVLIIHYDGHEYFTLMGITNPLPWAWILHYDGRECFTMMGMNTALWWIWILHYDGYQ